MTLRCKNCKKDFYTTHSGKKYCTKECKTKALCLRRRKVIFKRYKYYKPKEITYTRIDRKRVKDMYGKRRDCPQCKTLYVPTPESPDKCLLCLRRKNQKKRLARKNLKILVQKS